MVVNESQRIYKAFKFVRNVTSEIDALYKALEDEILKISEEPGQSFSLQYDEEHHRPAGTYNWLCEAWDVSFSLSEKADRKKMVRGYLFYLFDLSYPRGPAEQLEQSVLCVGYVSAKAYRNYPKELTIDAFFPWQPTTPDEDEKRWELSNDRKIWFWTGAGSNLGDLDSSCWVYFVPLALIPDRQAVSRILIRPALDILHKKNRSSVAKVVEILSIQKG